MIKLMEIPCDILQECNSVEVCVRNGVETYSLRHPTKEGSFMYLEWLERNNSITNKQVDTASILLTRLAMIRGAYINCTDPLEELRVYPKGITSFIGYHINHHGDIVKEKVYGGGYVSAAF